MDLSHITVAADESDAGRGAVRAGMDLAARATARLTIMRTVPIPAVRVLVGVRGGSNSFVDEAEDSEVERLRSWLEAEVLPADHRKGVELAITCGVPGVEICRFAESRESDLLVLGRKPRSQMTRMLLGDTADAVARRSRVACLFVQPEARPIRRVLAALDGGERGLAVLTTAGGFAASIGAELRTVTVEHSPAGEPPELAGALPLERSARLQSLVRTVAGRAGRGAELQVRRGPIVEEILAAVWENQADALVVGYHRGGPPGVIEAGSTARRLAHTAGCAVLTVPL